jgi:predicted flap endonuclease-1-like 5' DNA nuclease
MTVELILAAFVGLVTGALLALWLDSQTLVRRVQDANAEKSKAQAELQKFQIRHRALEQEVQAVKMASATAVQDTTQFEATIARQLAEIEASRDQLQTTIQTNEALRENLLEAQDRLEELQGLNLMAEAKLSASEAENNRLVGDVQLVEAEIALLEAKVAQANNALQQAQDYIAALEQKVAAAEAQTSAIEAEKDLALTQLQEAELTAAEQNARIATLEKQVRDAELVRQDLQVARNRLETADTHIQKLQDSVEDAHAMVSYSGKNELQLIRGIGPAYARRLNEFGINSFNDLAKCDPQQIATIIKKKNWQAADIQDWIDEAKALAARLGPEV